MVHLHSCKGSWTQNFTEPSRKRPQAQLTLAQRANEIFTSMKREHTSAYQVNVNRLIVNPSIATRAAVMSRGHDMDVVDHSIHGVDDYGTNSEFHFEQENNSTPDAINNASNDRYEFRSNLNPPPGVKFGVHLLHVISSHRGVDLKLYDEIIDLIKNHATTQDTDFATHKLYHRKELTRTLSTLYNLGDLQPILHNVTLSDSSVVSVPVFDVKAVILAMLHDTRKMQSTNFASGYDIFTGKCTTVDYNHLDEIHTGALWNIARDHYCHENENEFPLALLCFYDKTHTDLHGALSCAPFITTFSFFNEAARGKDEFYGVLGYIPNLSYGTGKSSIKLARDKLNDEHCCLRLITDQIRELSHGFDAVVLGRSVTIKPWIHFIAGDTSGHNNLVGQYNSSQAAFPYRDCSCLLSQMSDPIAQCKLITLTDFHDAKQSNKLADLSLHNIDNAFHDIPFGDMVHGIFGCVPAEMLHVSGNGIMQYQLDVVSKIISSGKNKRRNLHSLDILHQNLVKDASLQSEQDIPRTSDRNGVTDGTKMSASERVGNIFLLLCALHTEQCKEIFTDGCNESRVSLEQMKQCIKLQLGFEKWVNDSNSNEDVARATVLVADLITRIKTSFPRSSGNQWCIPKMHSLSKMTHYMKHFGKAKNFSGHVGERILKSIVKDHSTKTQRRANVFASQCADREFESFVFEYAYNDIAQILGDGYDRLDNLSTDIVIIKGKHTISFSSSDNRGRGDFSVKWHDKKRNSIDVPIHDMVAHTLRTYALTHEWTSPFVVNGYTSAQLLVDGVKERILFHANPYIYGGERYHFCMVKFTDDNEENEYTCPARILSFVQFPNNSIPSPDGKHHEVYAIVHTATDYISWEAMDKSFVLPFCLGDMRSCVFIINVNSICDPLFVCPNYGKDGTHYLCCLPYRRWGNYFRNQMKE